METNFSKVQVFKTRDIVFLLNLTTFSIFGAFSKIYCNYLNIEVR